MASQFRRGKLKDRNEVLTGLSQISFTLEDLRNEVLRQDRVDHLRKQLVPESTFTKRQATVQKTKDKATAEFEEARAKFSAAMQSVQLEEASIASGWAIFSDTSRKLNELITDDERKELVDLESELAAKRQLREGLVQRVGKGTWWRGWGSGTSHSTHHARLISLRQSIASDEAAHKKSQDATHRAKLTDRIASARAAIKMIEAESAADTKKLAALEAEIVQLDAKRGQLSAALIRG